MTASFITDPYNPYILIKFSKDIYKYYGFELGFFDIMRRRYSKRPGALANHLKTLKSIKVEKLCY